MDYSDFYQIIKSKRESRGKLDELSDKASVFLYAALLRGDTLQSIKKSLFGMADETGMPRLKPIKAALGQIATTAWRKSQTPGAEPSEAAFRAVGTEVAWLPLDRTENEWLREEEARQKDIVLGKALEEPKEVPESVGKLKAFCLCSRHDDCAKDHEPYQGKLYVKKWALRYPEIKGFCQSNGIKTVEWAIGKPVWMTTRPNCRHFFAEITFAEASEKSVRWMLKEHRMDRAVGTRSTQQNVRHQTQKQWYTEENILRTIKQYKDRLKRHLKMKEVATNENLENAIAKDRFMIRKWEQYLAKLRKEGRI